MQIASDIHKKTTVAFEDNVTILEGQAITGPILGKGTVLPVSSATAWIFGIAMWTLPAKEAYNPNGVCIPVNGSRCMTTATEGLVPVRVKDAAAYAALTVGGNFGIVTGDAVAVGTGGSTAASANSTGNPLFIREKRQVGGQYYILVEFN